MVHFHCNEKYNNVEFHIKRLMLEMDLDGRLHENCLMMLNLENPSFLLSCITKTNLSNLLRLQYSNLNIFCDFIYKVFFNFISFLPSTKSLQQAKLISKVQCHMRRVR